MKTGEPIQILMAEDDYLVGRSVRHSLEQSGYAVLGVAPSGKRAVEMVLSLSPDVVVMDIKMPEMDGLEAARLIQEQQPTPVVILTAHESQDLVEKATEAGVAAYLTKPPDRRSIERAITVAMARHGDLMELRRLNKELEGRRATLERKNEELEAALAEIKTLRGILPVCSFCKKVRNDEGYWEQVDLYIGERTEADISHSICPECLTTHYPGVGRNSDGPSSRESEP